MKRILIAALLAASSLNAHAARFAIQLGAFSNPTVAQSLVEKLTADGIPAYSEQRGDKTLLRAGPFASRDDASAAIAKIRAGGLMDNSESNASAPSETSAPAIDYMQVAKEMDAAWQIYDVREHRCVTIPVFMYRTLGRNMDIRTPEEFANAYGNGVSVKYGHGGEAAVVLNQSLPDDAPQTQFFFGHGTKVCNELASAMHADGN
jgi:hypothetical protein